MLNFRTRIMILLTLDAIVLMCSLKVKYVSNIRPECFCDETCWTCFLLRKIGGCTTFLTLRVKINSCACLVGSRLKLIVHWKNHFFILSKYSQSCLAVTFRSFVIVNKDVSSAKSFGADWRFSVNRLNHGTFATVSTNSSGRLDIPVHYTNDIWCHLLSSIAWTVAFYRLGNLTIIVINCRE